METVGEPVRKSDHRYTYGEYLSWDDEERWEIIDGVAWNMSPAPNRGHQGIAAQILKEAMVFLEGMQCKVYGAPFDVVLPESPEQSAEDSPAVVQPDISVIRDRSKLTDAGRIGAPKLVSERTHLRVAVGRSLL